MANEISDTESIASSGGSATEHLKAPSGAKSKVWKYFGFTTNEAGPHNITYIRVMVVVILLGPMDK